MTELDFRTANPFVLTPNKIDDFGTFWTIRAALRRIQRYHKNTFARNLEMIRFEIEPAGWIKVRVVAYQNLAAYPGILKSQQP